MQRHGVVDLTADLPGSQVLDELIAARHPDDVLVEDGFAVLADLGRLNDGTLELFRVVGGVLAAGLGPGVQVRQLDQQGGGLDRVQAEVAADVLVIVLGLAAVISHHAKAMGQGLVAGDDHAAVADTAEVLAGKEAETPAGADRAGFAALVSAGDGLGRVLDDGQAVAARDGHDWVHVRHLSEQVDGHDRLGVLADDVLDLLGVDVVRDGVNVHEDRAGAGPPDAAGGGEERERGRDDLVADADVQAHQGVEQGIGAAGDADGVRAVGHLGDGLFKLLDLGPADTHLRIEHIVDLRQHLVPDLCVLRLQIQQGYLHERRSPFHVESGGSLPGTPRGAQAGGVG